MKSRRGLDRNMQDCIAEMVQGRPEDDDPEEWYAAARVLDANRAANQAFHSTQRVVAPTPGFRATFPAPNQLRFAGISFPNVTIPRSTCMSIQHPNTHGDRCGAT